MRVGIVALLHESNTFISEPTTFEHFRENVLATGETVRTQFADTHHEVGGFFAGLDQAGLEAVPIFAARAVPFGTIAKDAFQKLVDVMLAELRQAGKIDGLLVAPHGATVSETHRDADGYWLSRVREAVGSELPIVGTLDAHANLSRRMVESCTALVAYRSNPHLDQRERGIEAATLLAGTLRGEIRPHLSAAFPPMAISIECQETGRPPCAPLYRAADEMLGQAAVLSNSILLGFPYADVAEMGSSAIVVTDNDATLAQDLSQTLARNMWNRRHDFAGRLIGIDEALDQATKLDGPVCLLDMGDNVGGGSPADGTWLAHAIHRRQVDGAFICLCDPAAVQQAEAAGVDVRVTMRVGGKNDDLHGAPLESDFTVVGIFDGTFDEPEPRHGGFTHCDQGRTAVVKTNRGLTVMLTSRRMPPFSLRQLTSCGIDPGAYQILVAKGVIAPVAAYQPVCRHLIRVNTAGVTSADMKTLAYKHRRRPMFPFEADAEWTHDALPS